MVDIRTVNPEKYNKDLAEALKSSGDSGFQRVVKKQVKKVVLTGAPPFDLDKVGWRKNGTEEADIENVGAVVAGGHHADGDANPRLAGFVILKKGA